MYFITSDFLITSSDFFFPLLETPGRLFWDINFHLKTVSEKTSPSSLKTNFGFYSYHESPRRNLLYRHQGKQSSMTEWWLFHKQTESSDWSDTKAKQWRKRHIQNLRALWDPQPRKILYNGWGHSNVLPQRLYVQQHYVKLNVQSWIKRVSDQKLLFWLYKGPKHLWKTDIQEKKLPKPRFKTKIMTEDPNFPIHSFSSSDSLSVSAESVYPSCPSPICTIIQPTTPFHLFLHLPKVKKKTVQTHWLLIAVTTINSSLCSSGWMLPIALSVKDFHNIEEVHSLGDSLHVCVGRKCIPAELAMRQGYYQVCGFPVELDYL